MSNDNTQLNTRGPLMPRDQFARTVLAVANKELTNLFGAEQGKAAAARVALAFRAAASTAKDPDAFYSCSPESVASCMATSAFTQIMPGGPFCGCYLIPKKVNGVQTLNWWINHRGIKTLARRAGQSVEAVPFFEGDEVIIGRGRNWRVEVIEGPAPDRDSFAAMLGFVYYVSDLETGALLAAGKMSKAQIQKRRAKGQGGSVWNEWPMEMSAKTVIKYAAGRGDVFFDDVGNMALSREAEVIDTTATEARPAAAPRQIGEDIPTRDFVAEAEELERQRAARVPVEGGEGGEGGNARTEPPNPLASLPGPVADRLVAFAEEMRTDAASVVAFLHSKGRDPAKLTDDKALAGTMLALSKGGGMHDALLEYIGRPSK